MEARQVSPRRTTAVDKVFSLLPKDGATRLKFFLLAKRITTRLGVRITPLSESLIDMEDEFKEIFEICREYTMTSIERMYSLYKAVDYITSAQISGDLVECGVWKGGSCMLMALTLLKRDDPNRNIYLYDTYSGMSEPTSEDYYLTDGHMASDMWQANSEDGSNRWCSFSLEEVRKNLLSTGYPEENLVFVKGMVEATIPKTAPEAISILRLDTDWYESTGHELRHLFPLLVDRGVLVIDDYGVMAGAKKAVDEYFSENDVSMFLSRVDYTGRIGIK
jgi:O-methyltransferase